jgi:alpha-tubulin suppressor-like RCC1 family protein
LGLKADGSVVAWGRNDNGQTNVPSPNSGFIAVAAGNIHSLAIRRATGDSDADGDVDLAHFAVFVDYLLGPFVNPQGAQGRFFDVDTDDDVDLHDLAAWQNRFTGD